MGQNRWLWVLMNAHYTLFHVDKSRGSEVVRKLLGEVYGGTLHTDFYSAYGEIDCQEAEVPGASSAGTAGYGREGARRLPRERCAGGSSG